MNNRLVSRFVFAIWICGFGLSHSGASAVNCFTQTCSALDDTDTIVKKLLKDFWTPTKKSEANAYFEAQSVENAKTVYAFALVKSRQHDVKAAIQALEKLEEIDPNNPQPQRLKCWLLLRQDKFNLALVSLGKFIDLANADKSLDDFGKTEAYRFAGRVFAYLEGPLKSRAHKLSIETSKRKILFKLDADLLSAFNFDYSVVEKDYQEMMGKKQTIDQNAAKIDAEERKIKFARLTEVEKQLAENKEDIAEKSGELRAEAIKVLEEIRLQDSPLASQQSQLESELGSINRDLLVLISDYNYWNTLALRENNQRLRILYFQRAGRADGLILRAELDANSVRSRLNVVESQRNDLRRQYAAIESNATQQLASLNSGLKNIEKQKRRTAIEKIKTTKPSKKTITHSVSLRLRSRSIATYDQFPLEIERQLLLDSIK